MLKSDHTDQTHYPEKNLSFRLEVRWIHNNFVAELLNVASTLVEITICTEFFLNLCSPLNYKLCSPPEILLIVPCESVRLFLYKKWLNPPTATLFRLLAYKHLVYQVHSTNIAGIYWVTIFQNGTIVFHR